MQVPQQALQAPVAARPWWRHGMVWMVIAGPAAVVVAGIVTAVIAFQGADPVVQDPAAAQAAEQSFDHQPAMQGRNHAATGGVPAAR
ncbi:nitrogen fixation protein FixH [Pseudorhodoferax sp.]|uniref:nitrogen fixation protein FixH n=1 Tax=Pseudorhodoferax sp. TaxID=1993553 RepID=UPI0039E41493